jgi:hypothetical protein
LRLRQQAYTDADASMVAKTQNEKLAFPLWLHFSRAEQIPTALGPKLLFEGVAAEVLQASTADE